jgi:DNA-binding CsgD family transcriptional regulator
MLDTGFDVVRASPIALSSSANRASDATRRLRELAAAADAHQARPLRLAAIWAELASGSYRALDAFTGQRRCYLVLEQRPAPPPSTGTQRNVDVLRRILVDGCQKCAAFDLTLAPSSISSLGNRAFTKLGFSGPIAQAPFILFLAARAATEGNAETARGVTVQTELRRLRVLSVERPDLHLEQLLSPALADVAAQLVAGKRRSEIASERRTSERTVSNQLRAIFASLNVTGRLSLLSALLAHTGPSAPVISPRENWQGRGCGVGTSA